MIIYNGFKPGETRTTTSKPKAADNGHSVVKMTTHWNGGAFRFTYRMECECGAKFATRSGRPEALLYRHARHQRLSAKTG